MKSVNRIGEQFGSSGQITAEDLAAIKAAGFKSIICNRPDNEDGGHHPDHQTIADAARELGLEFAYLPVIPGQITDADILSFRQKLQQLPAPTLAYCRSGNRSRLLYDKSR